MNWKKIIRYIGQYHLFASTDKILVALSGGADSVALLRILLELGYECEAAHCNFHLRGEESERDEQFVRKLCADLQVPLHVVQFDTLTEAKDRHISIEMAARELRYEWFEQVRQSCGAAVIAVAHHRDDNVETFLLNLTRGTGINGLRGMRPRNGRVVRPLLCIDRKEITDYLGETGQTYVTDSTNLQDVYTRNKIRLRLLPILEEINPSVKDSITQTARYLDDAALIYNKCIEDALKRIRTPQGICIPALLDEPAPETLLFEALHPYGFRAPQVNDIFRSLTSQSGKVFDAGNWRVVKDRDRLLIAQRGAGDKPVLVMEQCDNVAGYEFSRNKNVAYFDADKLTEPLTLRRWEHGDVFVPFGMKGRKKVSDYLIDHKFSLLQKSQLWVLCCGANVIWLVGERSDNRYRVDPCTRKILRVEVVE